VERIKTEEALGDSNRSSVLALALQQANQPVEGLQKRLAQTVAYRNDPLVITTGQHIALVHLHRLGESPARCFEVLGAFRLISLGQCTLELLHIQCPGDIWALCPPLETLSCDVKEGIGIG